jgi:hypothetical protein
VYGFSLLAWLVMGLILKMLLAKFFIFIFNCSLFFILANSCPLFNDGPFYLFESCPDIFSG